MRILRLTFAVLALMSVFTACTKEEMSVPQAEVAGAKLLGTNLSAEFPLAADTKTDANGNWVAGDKLGLAMLSEDNLAANYMFVKETNDGDFTSYGNIYEGTHFAYYPYAYMATPGTAKKVFINPAQTQTLGRDIFATRLHLSTAEVLTAAHNLDGDKLVNGHFAMRRAVKALDVTLKIDEGITTSEALKNLKIKRVTLTTEATDNNNAGPAMFFGGEITLKPSALVAPVYVDEDGEPVESTGVCTNENCDHGAVKPPKYPAGATYSETETAKAFYASLMDVFGSVTYANSLATLVDNDTINLSANQNIRFYTLPKADVYSADLYKSLKLRVDVQNGYFLVEFKAGTQQNPLTTAETANVTALKALADLYKVTTSGVNTTYGYLAAFTPEHEAKIGHSTGLEFTLDESMFHQTFNNIASEDDWNAAVAMVDALGIKSPAFTIVQGATPWKFTDKDNNGALVNLPTSTTLTSLTVTGNNMYLDKADATAPITSAKFVVKTEVFVEKDLKVTGKFEATKITNKATISAGAAADIKNLVNTGKRVVAEYGAKVDNYGADADEKADNKGTVAYKVNAVTQDDYAKVRTMLTENAIKVNTLIIDGVAFDLNAKCVAAGGNGYVTTGAEYLSEGGVLANITFELVNGGSLTANNTDLAVASRENKVGQVISKSGNNTITDIHPAGLEVEAGTLTAINTELCGSEDVVVAEDATLNLNPTPATRSASSTNSVAYVDELTVDGTLNININGLTARVATVSSTGALNVSGYNYFVWSEKGELKGTTSGTISRGAKDTATLTNLLGLANDGDVVYLTANITDATDLVIAKSITLNLNGKKLNGSIKSSEDLVVLDGSIENANTGKSGIEVTGTAKLTLTNVNVKSARHAVRVKSSGAVVINGGKYEVAGLTSTHGTLNAVNAGDNEDTSYTANVTINGGEFIGGGNLAYSSVQVQGKAVMTINDGKFSTVGDNPAYLLYVDGESTETAKFVCKGGKYKGFNPSSYVATGYESKAMSATGYTNWYEVKAK